LRDLSSPEEAKRMTTMGHRVFGHFDDAQSARAAYAELREGQALHPKISVHVRTPGKAHEDLPMAMTDARRGTFRAIALSGIIGAVSVAVLVGLGARWIGFSPSWAFLGAIGGMALGALAGFLQGAGHPHPRLVEFENEGGVLLAVRSDDAEDRAWAEQVLRRHEARVDEPARHAHHPSYAR
jgi:hypothetical protein